MNSNTWRSYKRSWQVDYTKDLDRCPVQKKKRAMKEVFRIISTTQLHFLSEYQGENKNKTAEQLLSGLEPRFCILVSMKDNKDVFQHNGNAFFSFF